ncbi:hypothetical protein [Aequorivita xiaoshiensis]|uniref:PepSY domain-containing protein n=1 Tax=Aequorivita xiaoshiensis TaxID=2874476 RepID=A0A9X1UBK6_9FLAO|nr:hypothetical protein [Aequorivita xiaoshiensis]MCG2429676.1 hypothetical protein [Aequorivita xiaoshiensis]
MKRLILSTAIVLGGLTAVTAQSDKEVTAKNEQKTATLTQVEEKVEATQELKLSANAVQDFKEVKASELPEAVQNAVANDFDGATISKAYVNAKGDYKIELTTADAKKATVYANAKGEWIKNELTKQ